jgi:acyl carrier protein
VVAVAADVTDRVRLEEAISAIPPEAPLRGVIHAAGALDDGLVADQDAARLARLAAPKIAGAAHLDALTRAAPLDFFVLFSSLAAVLGSAGQATYAAANAYLDALATARRAAGLPGLSIAWGPWSGAGLGAVDGAARRRLEGRGIGALEPEEGTALFGRALGFGRPCVVAAALDLPAVLVGGAPPAPPPSPAPPLAGLAPTALETHIAAIARSEAAAVLGLPGPDAVPLERPLRELGLDSLMALELRNRLARRTGLALPATLAFDHPTVAEQVRALLRAHGGAEPPPPPSARPREEAGPAPAADLAAALDRELSRAEELLR